MYHQPLRLHVSIVVFLYKKEVDEEDMFIYVNK